LAEAMKNRMRTPPLLMTRYWTGECDTIRRNSPGVCSFEHCRSQETDETNESKWSNFWLSFVSLVSISCDWNWETHWFENKIGIFDPSFDQLWGWWGWHPKPCEFEFVQFIDLWWVLRTTQTRQCPNHLYPRDSDQFDDVESFEKDLLVPLHMLQLYPGDSIAYHPFGDQAQFNWFCPGPPQ
jgi:hypothetical protein